MRPLLAIAALTWLGFSLGCVAFQDEIGQVALDYEIDRVLVPAIRLTPPIAVEGEDVEIEALVLSPWNVDSVSLDICGQNPDLPTELWGAECFNNPDLIEPLSLRNPAVWTVPELGRNCIADSAEPVDTGIPTDCASQIPIRATGVAGEERGMGTVQVRVLRDGPATLPSLNDARRELTFEGNPARGEDIGLVYRVDWDGPVDFRWYVDAGELHHTGRTTTTWLQGDRHTTRNQLAIPSGYVGPLRVVVVVADPDSGGWRSPTSGNLAWDILTLEVE
ncbi:MAG: hypothetical protein KC912_01295 [Proteobacteria bacterium]|nr:hypothetical protein [Pseudomonadota bacterium]